MIRLKHKIICDDCIEVMKEMESDSVDLVVTDPPYNVGKDFGIRAINRMKSNIYQ